MIESAQPCGCDLGHNPPHLCAEHKFRTKALTLIKVWREEAQHYLDGNEVSYYQGVTLLGCANNLGGIL